MILISQNLSNYEIPIPENSVYRINLAWVNDIKELVTLVEKHKEHSIFVDLPINRTKPPNNKYTLNDIITILKKFDNIRYLAVSNVEKEEDLDQYIKLVPKTITIVPKIESHRGVDNIEKIVKKLDYNERIIMLDHDDLYSNLIKSNMSSDKFSFYINKLAEFSKNQNITLLRTIGIVFSDETKNVSDYVR